MLKTLLASAGLLSAVSLSALAWPSVAAGQATRSDSADVEVTFSAIGGSVTRQGLYTVASTAGPLRVVASFRDVADTSNLTLASPTGSAAKVSKNIEVSRGIPFGPFDAWNATGLKANTDVFTASIGSINPKNIVERIATAQSKGIKLILTMTGGSHENYMSAGVFDMLKWEAKMNAYNTPVIRAAVSGAVANGTVIGNSVMDEPHVFGQGEGNTWGPRGTMTKERVDQMCAYVKQIFPTLAAGVVHSHRAFEPEKSYRVCDFIVDQYAWRLGSVTQFRDEGLAMARRDGIAIVFSMNILNGGFQAARNGAWECSPKTTGGRGTYEPNCRMTPEQVRDWGQTLGPAGCAFVLWRYDDLFMSNSQNQRAFADIASQLATLPSKACRATPR